MKQTHAMYFGSVVAGLTLFASVIGSADIAQAAQSTAHRIAPVAATQSDTVVRVGRGASDNKKCPKSADNGCAKFPPPPPPKPQ